MNKKQFEALEQLLIFLESQGVDLLQRQLALSLRTLRQYLARETGRRRVKTFMLLDDHIPATARFPLGHLIVTHSVWEQLRTARRQLAEFIYRHAGCDWGECGATERNRAYQQPVPLFSSYLLEGTTKVWIITEADRSRTTILLPHEFDVLYAAQEVALFHQFEVEARGNGKSV
ncbi:MAG: hypothetical protein ACKV2V_28950 [Blastocatellia bacterium]